MSSNQEEGDDTSSIITELPQYSVHDDRQPRPASPSPSYRTIGSARIKSSDVKSSERPPSPTPSYRTVDPFSPASRKDIQPRPKVPAQSFLNSFRPDLRASRLVDACAKGHWDRVLGILANRPRASFNRILLEEALRCAMICRNEIPRSANNDQHLEMSKLAIKELIKNLGSTIGHASFSDNYLIEAIKSSRNEEIIERILDRSTQRNMTVSLIQVLISDEHNVMYARLLIEAGADINYHQVDGRTPLHLVAMKWKSSDGAEIIRLMHKKGATLYGGRLRAIEPLSDAIKASNHSAMNTLLDLGVNVDAESMKEACKLDTRIVEELIARDPKAVNIMDSKMTPVLETFAGGTVGCTAKLLQSMLDAGANVNAISNDRMKTALHVAVESQNTEFVQVLLDHGAKTDYREGVNGNTALHMAAMKGMDSPGTTLAADMIGRLLEASADVNAKNFQDRTPLHFAVAHRHGRAAVEALIAGGADVNAKDFQDDIPLLKARCCILRRMLVEAGVDTTRLGKACIAFVPVLPEDGTYVCSPHPHCRSCSSNSYVYYHSTT